MPDDVRDIVPRRGPAGISAALGRPARTCLWKRRLRRKRAFSGLPDGSESLPAVNRDPAASEPAVHRFDVFALLELSAPIKDCGAHVQVVTQDVVRQGSGERTDLADAHSARVQGPTGARPGVPVPPARCRYNPRGPSRV